MSASPEISYTDITEVYLQELRRGNRVSIQALAKKFPNHAPRILAEFPTMATLEGSIGKAANSLPTIPGYRLIEEIGRGSFGIVFKARHESGKVAAVKLVKVHDELIELSRIEREIDILSRLRHPHIVSIDSFGIIGDWVYIVTNYIEGITLAELLSENPTVQGRFWISELQRDWRLLAGWGLEIASALEFAHRHKIIHRDIKPSNLLVDRSGKCWIIDFGLSRAGDLGMTVTHSGQVVGTPRYMAPEQLQGVVDARCDVFSLGRTLFDIAAKHLPTESHTMTAQPSSEAVLAAAPRFGEVIDKACEPHPERRFQTAKELVAVLSRLLEGKTPCDRRRVGMRMSEVEFKSAMRRKVRYAVAGGVLCFGGLLALLVGQSLAPAREQLPGAIAKPQESNESLKKLASAIESEDTGFVELIGEAVKHSVVNQSSDKTKAAEVSSKIDRIVEKVSTEGLKPGQLDSLIASYRNSPLMNANKINALHHPLERSTLGRNEKLQGHATLQLFSKAIVNKKIQAEKADRVLASLFNGNVPRLEQIIAMQIPNEVLSSWLNLVQFTFGSEMQQVASDGNLSNHEINGIIESYLKTSE